MKWFSRKAKEPEGWQHFHFYDKDGNLLLARKYGTKDYKKWNIILVARKEDMERAERNKGLGEVELSRDDLSNENEGE